MKYIRIFIIENNGVLERRHSFADDNLQLARNEVLVESRTDFKYWISDWFQERRIDFNQRARACLTT